MTLTSKQVDGILISTAQNVTDYSVYKQVIERGIPLVFYDRCVNDLGVSCVSIDDEFSAKNITTHLIQHGYFPIAHLSGPERILINQKRYKEFTEALKAYDLEVISELVIESGLQELDGYTAMNKIINWPKSE